MVEFTIHGELPNLNEIIAVSKKHWSSYSRMKKTYTHLVKLHARNLPKIEQADFEITWYCKDRRQDKDNVIAGQKFIFDGLVDAGVLINDGWSQIGDIKHTFEVDKKNPRVEVRIEEVS
ncbi:RusA family crossover junction endodeoxyribonuclease [Lederbergia galactosidilytica]|uniref:Holliday junction resolvase n=1 Tax=Lederbergia galactosidilytica TaxID=217031 RepID=A0A177ZQ22_9BACI|nr:RusA family crossover junction endodeoxyribonuclease [Lederbergia galactosidilytica]OAK70076.1 Holliday junction resolvase [Lederbergia galactosidilytica]